MILEPVMCIDVPNSIILVVVAIGLPVFLTVLHYLPFFSTLLDKVKPYLWPSTIGTFQIRPLPYLLGNAPTRGQALYLVVFGILNVIACAIDYRIRQPSAWYATAWRELVVYIFYRFGAYSFVLFPVVFLFSTRNNVLLWMTNWSHSTYLLLHRWTARLFTLYAILHSILGLIVYADAANEPYWKWGAAATVLATVLMLGSGLYVRAKNYEFFLISHIVLSVFVVAGSWYHIIGWYNSMGMNWPEHTAGSYEIWIYMACAIWFFDRLVRVLRMVKLGIRRSRVTEIGEGIIRVDVPGVRLDHKPGMHVYAYFPTVTPLRPWENHPFSVIPTAMLESASPSKPGSVSNGSGHEDVEASKETKVSIHRTKAVRDALPPVGITLFIRKSAGMTKAMRAHDSLLTLLDGPYPNNETRALLRCDRLLIIGGGIGITGLLPWTRSHWNTKLAWSVREPARGLVDALEDALAAIADKEIRVGSRLDVAALLAEEVAAGWGRVGVVVSGPGGLCDAVRAEVAAAGRQNKSTVFELEVDAYSW
jgi:hypothetical protein